MAITTYAELQTAVARWLGNTDSATTTTVGIASTITDLITVAEKRIFREARTRDMETALSSAISSGVVAVPAGYVQLKFAYVDGSPTSLLKRRSAESIYAQYPVRSASGTPVLIGREGTNFIFGPYPDSAYTIKGSYYARLTAISGSGVNALFTANPDLYLFGCLAESIILIGQDSRIPLWEAKYKQVLSEVNGEDDDEDHSGGSLQMVAV
jgi:hypothetical protein